MKNVWTRAIPGLVTMKLHQNFTFLIQEKKSQHHYPAVIPNEILPIWK